MRAGAEKVVEGGRQDQGTKVAIHYLTTCRAETGFQTVLAQQILYSRKAGFQLLSKFCFLAYEKLDFR